MNRTTISLIACLPHQQFYRWQCRVYCSGIDEVVIASSGRNSGLLVRWAYTYSSAGCTCADLQCRDVQYSSRISILKTVACTRSVCFHSSPRSSLRHRQTTQGIILDLAPSRCCGSGHLPHHFRCRLATVKSSQEAGAGVAAKKRRLTSSAASAGTSAGVHTDTPETHYTRLLLAPKTCRPVLCGCREV